MNKNVKIIQIDSDKLYMKKGYDGWRIVYPMFDENKKAIWKNIIWFGGFWRFVKILLLIALILSLVVAWGYDTKICQDMVKRDKEYWNNMTNGTGKIEHNKDSGLNLSAINLSDIEVNDGTTE